MTIEVVFGAKLYAHDQNYVKISTPEDVLANLHAVVSSEDDYKMAQYLIDEPATSPLHGISITDGSMIIVREADSLFVYTRYFIEQSLTGTQMDALKDFTKGQLSDGAGECFMQDLFNHYHLRFTIDTDTICAAP